MDITETIIAVLDGVKVFDFNAFAQVLAGSFAILWAFVVLWVWNDASERSSNLLFKAFVTLFVLPFNFVGLLVYYLIRPKQTIEELYWADLERRYLIYETADLQDCTKCGYQLMPGYNVCPQCANVIKVKCEKCELMIDKDHKYCPFCGEQRLKRAVTPEILSQEVMAQSIEEQKAEVIESVNTNKTKYATKSGVASKVGGVVVKAVLGFGKKIDDTVRSAVKPKKTAVEDLKVDPIDEKTKLKKKRLKKKKKSRRG